MGFSRCQVVCALSVVLLFAGCGGGETAGGEPPQAIDSYLTALANNEGQNACDLLTVRARAQIVEDAGNADCPALVDQFHTFLGGDADRLKDAKVSDVVVNDDTATASVELDGNTVKVDLRRVDGEWRIDTFAFARSLIGVP